MHTRLKFALRFFFNLLFLVLGKIQVAFHNL